MLIQEDSNKSYTLLVAHHQTILGYSIINQPIIRFYGIDAL